MNTLMSIDMLFGFMVLARQNSRFFATYDLGDELSGIYASRSFDANRPDNHLSGRADFYFQFFRHVVFLCQADYQFRTRIFTVRSSETSSLTIAMFRFASSVITR